MMLLLRVFFCTAAVLSVYGMSSTYRVASSCSKCGLNAQCSIVQERYVCACISGHKGDPLDKCIPLTEEEQCMGQCGKGALCKVRNSVIFCRCPTGFLGDARVACRPECESDNDCANERHLCRENRCRNPCEQCGKNAVCDVIDRRAKCTCPDHYLGDPYTHCQPECETHADCENATRSSKKNGDGGSEKRHCFNGKCIDLCDGVCGVNANCRLRGTTPVCSCPKNMTGDPFENCRPFELSDLCDPNPCGLRAICRPGYDDRKVDRPVCSCPSGYYGNALMECRKGECSSNSECSASKACIDSRCQDVCIEGVCGVDADCNGRNHIAVCTCPLGSNGNAKIQCHKN